jgi:hypothetical protein
MKTIFPIICYLLLSHFVLKAQDFPNPVSDFLGHVTRDASDSMYKVIVPNRSGGNDILLSYSSWSDGRAGHDWIVYAPTGGGYKRLNNLISFKRNTLSVGNFKELGGIGMLTYAPDAGGKGSLIGYIFDGTNVRQMNLGTIEFSGKDKALTDKYFTVDKHPSIEVTPADHLPPKSP